MAKIKRKQKKETPAQKAREKKAKLGSALIIGSSLMGAGLPLAGQVFQLPVKVARAATRVPGQVDGKKTPDVEFLRVNVYGVGAAELNNLRDGESYRIEVGLPDGALANQKVILNWRLPDVVPLSFEANLDARGGVEYSITPDTPRGTFILESVSFNNLATPVGEEFVVVPSTPEPPKVTVSGVRLSHDFLSFTSGERAVIEAGVTYSDGTADDDFSLKVGDSNIFSASKSGRQIDIQSLAPGSAELKVISNRDPSKTAVLNLVVEAKPAPVTVSRLELNKTSVSLVEGESSPLLVKVVMSDGSENYKFSYEDSNKGIVELVPSLGGIGSGYFNLVAKKAGDTIITFSAGDKKAELTVQVKAAPAPTLRISSLKVIPAPGVDLANLKIGDKYKLVAKAREINFQGIPSGKEVPLANIRIKTFWSEPETDGYKIIYRGPTKQTEYEFDLDKNGEIEFTITKNNAPGDYVLKSAEFGGGKVEINQKLKIAAPAPAKPSVTRLALDKTSIKLEEGKSSPLLVNVVMSDGSENFDFNTSNSNPEVADLVPSLGGLGGGHLMVRAKKAGTTTLTFTAKDDPSKTVALIVEVTPKPVEPKIKEAIVAPVGSADLLNLKDGDKYILRVRKEMAENLLMTVPLANETIKTFWILPDGKDQEIEFQLDAKGEIEFAVSQQNKRGDYELKQLKWKNQSLKVGQKLKIVETPVRVTVSSIILDKTSLNLKEGERSTLQVKVVMSDGSENHNFTHSDSNLGVVQIAPTLGGVAGGQFAVLATKAGKTTLTFTADADPAKKANLTVEVVAIPKPVEYPKLSEVKISPLGEAKLDGLKDGDKYKISVFKRETNLLMNLPLGAEKITAVWNTPTGEQKTDFILDKFGEIEFTVSSGNARGDYELKKVIWGKQELPVNKTLKIVSTPAPVTVSRVELLDKNSLKLNSLNLTEGETQKFLVKVVMSDGSKNYKFKLESNSDFEVAELNEKQAIINKLFDSGEREVIAKKQGSATLIFASEDDSSKKASLTIQVAPKPAEYPKLSKVEVSAIPDAKGNLPILDALKDGDKYKISVLKRETNLLMNLPLGSERVQTFWATPEGEKQIPFDLDKFGEIEFTVSSGNPRGDYELKKVAWGKQELPVNQKLKIVETPVRVTVSSIVLDKTSLNLKQGETSSLRVKVIMSDGSENYKFSFSNSNPEIIDITPNTYVGFARGNFEISAKKEGKATVVFAADADKNKTAELMIEVVPKPVINQLSGVIVEGVDKASLLGLKNGDSYKIIFNGTQGNLSSQEVALKWKVTTEQSVREIETKDKTNSLGELSYQISEANEPGYYDLLSASAGNITKDTNYSLRVIGNLQAPKIVSLDKASYAPGDTVIITAENLTRGKLGNSITMRVVGEEKGFAIIGEQNDKQISFKLHPDKAEGKYEVSVTTIAGTSDWVSLEVKKPAREAQLSKVEVSPLDSADLLNLKDGDKYKIKALDDKDQPLAGQLVSLFWSLNGRDLNLPVELKFDQNGEFEFTVSQNTLPGDYVLKKVQYKTQTLELEKDNKLRVVETFGGMLVETVDLENTKLTSGVQTIGKIKVSSTFFLQLARLQIEIKGEKPNEVFKNLLLYENPGTEFEKVVGAGQVNAQGRATLFTDFSLISKIKSKIYELRSTVIGNGQNYQINLVRLEAISKSGMTDQVFTQGPLTLANVNTTKTEPVKNIVSAVLIEPVADSSGYVPYLQNLINGDQYTVTVIGTLGELVGEEMVFSWVHTDGVGNKKEIETPPIKLDQDGKAIFTVSDTNPRGDYEMIKVRHGQEELEITGQKLAMVSERTIIQPPGGGGRGVGLLYLPIHPSKLTPEQQAVNHLVRALTQKGQPVYIGNNTIIAANAFQVTDLRNSIESFKLPPGSLGGFYIPTEGLADFLLEIKNLTPENPFVSLLLKNRILEYKNGEWIIPSHTQKMGILVVTPETYTHEKIHQLFDMDDEFLQIWLAQFNGLSFADQLKIFFSIKKIGYDYYFNTGDFLSEAIARLGTASQDKNFLEMFKQAHGDLGKILTDYFEVRLHLENGEYKDIKMLVFEYSAEESKFTIEVFDKEGKLVGSFEFSDDELAKIFPTLIEESSSNVKEGGVITFETVLDKVMKVLSEGTTHLGEEFNGIVVLKDGSMSLVNNGIPRWTLGATTSVPATNAELNALLGSIGVDRIFKEPPSPSVVFAPKLIAISPVPADISVMNLGKLPPGSFAWLYTNHIVLYKDANGNFLGSSSTFHLGVNPSRPPGLPDNALPLPDGNWVVVDVDSLGEINTTVYDKNGNFIPELNRPAGVPEGSLWTGNGWMYSFRDNETGTSLDILFDKNGNSTAVIIDGVVTELEVEKDWTGAIIGFKPKGGNKNISQILSAANRVIPIGPGFEGLTGNQIPGLGQKGYLVIGRGGTIVWIPYSVYSTAEPRPKSTKHETQTIPALELKSAKIVLVDKADLLNLKVGDKYKLVAMGNTGPMSRESELMLSWSLDGKDQEPIKITIQNSDGEAEFTISETTPVGQYFFKELKYKGQSGEQKAGVENGKLKVAESEVKMVELISFMQANNQSTRGLNLVGNALKGDYDKIWISKEPTQTIPGKSVIHEIYWLVDQNFGHSVSIGEAELGIDAQGGFNGKNNLTFYNFKTGGVLATFSQEIDLDGLSLKVTGTYENKQFTFEFVNGQGKAVLTEGGKIIQSLDIKIVFEDGKTILLVYNEKGDLLSYTEVDMENMQAVDIILDGFNLKSGIFTNPDVLKTPDDSMIMKYGSLEQKFMLWNLGKFPESKITRQSLLGSGFTIKHFENGLVGLFSNESLLRFYDSSKVFPIYIWPLSDGTYEVILSDGTGMTVTPDFRIILEIHGSQAVVEGKVDENSPLRKLAGSNKVLLPLGNPNNPEGYVYINPQTRDVYVYDPSGELKGMVINETGNFVQLSPVYEKDPNGNTVLGPDGKPVVKGYEPSNGWPGGFNPFDASNRNIPIGPGFGSGGQPTPQPGQKGYLEIQGKQIVWIPYTIYPRAEPRPKSTKYETQTIPALELKSAKIEAVKPADLANLKVGDKYKLVAMGNTGPMSRESELILSWSLDGKDQESIKITIQNSDGEVEFTITESTPAGTYDFKELKYKGQTGVQTVKLERGRLRVKAEQIPPAWFNWSSNSMYSWSTDGDKLYFFLQDGSNETLLGKWRLIFEDSLDKKKYTAEIETTKQDFFYASTPAEVKIDRSLQSTRMGEIPGQFRLVEVVRLSDGKTFSNLMTYNQGIVIIPTNPEKAKPTQYQIESPVNGEKISGDRYVTGWIAYDPMYPVAFAAVKVDDQWYPLGGGLGEDRPDIAPRFPGMKVKNFSVYVGFENYFVGQHTLEAGASHHYKEQNQTVTGNRIVFEKIKNPGREAPVIESILKDGKPVSEVKAGDKIEVIGKNFNIGWNQLYFFRDEMGKSEVGYDNAQSSDGKIVEYVIPLKTEFFGKLFVGVGNNFSGSSNLLPLTISGVSLPKVNAADNGVFVMETDEVMNTRYYFNYRDYAAKILQEMVGDKADFIAIIPSNGAQESFNKINPNSQVFGDYLWYAKSNIDGIFTYQTQDPSRLQALVQITGPKSGRIDDTTLMELGHRWGVYWEFPYGEVDDRAWGHWGQWYSDASAMSYSNLIWTDNKDSTFTAKELTNKELERFNDLDLYAMGLVGPDEVKPSFAIRDAKRDPGNYNKVTGKRLDLTVQDIINLNGLRKPGTEASQKEFTIAFLYLKMPGEDTTVEQQNVVVASKKLNDTWQKATRGKSSMKLLPKEALQKLTAQEIAALSKQAEGFIYEQTPEVKELLEHEREHERGRMNLKEVMERIPVETVAASQPTQTATGQAATSQTPSSSPPIRGTGGEKVVVPGEGKKVETPVVQESVIASGAKQSQEGIVTRPSVTRDDKIVKETPPISVPPAVEKQAFPKRTVALAFFPGSTDIAGEFDQAVVPIYMHNDFEGEVKNWLNQNLKGYYNIAAIDSNVQADRLVLIKKAEAFGFDAIELDEPLMRNALTVEQYHELKKAVNIPIAVTDWDYNLAKFIRQGAQLDAAFVELYNDNWRTALDEVRQLTNAPVYAVINIADPMFFSSHHVKVIAEHAWQNADSVWFWGWATGVPKFEERARANWPLVREFVLKAKNKEIKGEKGEVKPITPPVVPPPVTAGTLASSLSNDQFVKILYRGILGREGEPAGLAGWTAALDQNQLIRDQVLKGFTGSPGFKLLNFNDEQFVKNLYQGILGREPDEGGFADWLNALRGGVSRNNVAIGFLNSQELAQKQIQEPPLAEPPKPLGVLPNEEGVNLEKIETVITPSQSPPAEQGEKIGSDESARYTSSTLASSLSNEQYIHVLYRSVLGREADSTGFDYWTDMLDKNLQNREQVFEAFLMSPEAKQKNFGDEIFVTNLYAGIHGRTPDAGGYAYWVDALENSENRETVARAFLESEELLKYGYRLL